MSDEQKPKFMYAFENGGFPSSPCAVGVSFDRFASFSITVFFQELLMVLLN